MRRVPLALAALAFAAAAPVSVLMASAPARLAVVGDGDPAIVVPVVQALEERAEAAGWTLTESPDEADRVLRVEFEVTGDAGLQAHRRSGTMNVGVLRVRALDANGQPQGAGLSRSLRYTPMTADAEALKAIDGATEAMVGVPAGA